MPRKCTDPDRARIIAEYPAARYRADADALGVSPHHLKNVTRGAAAPGFGLAVRMHLHRPALAVEEYMGRSLPRVRLHREYQPADLLAVAQGLTGQLDAADRPAFIADIQRVVDAHLGARS